MIKFLNKNIFKFDNFIPNFIENLSSTYFLYFILSISQFLLIPLYIKYLGLSSFGELMFLISFVNFASIGTGFLSGSLLRMLGEYNAKKDELNFMHTYRLGKIIFIFYSLMFLLVTFIIWNFLSIANVISFNLPNSFIYFCLYFILFYEQIVDKQCLQSINKIKLLNYIEAIKTIYFVVMIFILLPIFKDDFTIWIVLISSLIIQKILFFIFFYNLDIKLKWILTKDNVKIVLRKIFGKLGFGYGIYGIINLVYISDIIIIGFLLGSEAVAKFIIIWKIPETIVLLITRVTSVIEPTIIKYDTNSKSKVIHIYNDLLFRYTFITILASVTYLIVGKYLSFIWLGDEASNNFYHYLLGSIAIVCMCYNKLHSTFLYCQTMFKSLITVSLIELIIKLIVVIITYKYLNISSVILGIIVSSLFYSMYAYRKSLIKSFI